METTTDTGARYTQDDLDAMCVEFEKQVNLYVALAEQMFERMSAKDLDDDAKALMLHGFDHVQNAGDRVVNTGALIQDLANVLPLDGTEWCRSDNKDEWSEQHKRFVEQLDRFHEMRDLVRSKIMRVATELNEMKAMEDFANGGGE